MSGSTAELRILITSKDSASNVIKGLGQNLGGLGVAGKVATAALAGIAVAGGALAGVIGKSVGAAMDFESAMSAVGAVAGASGSELDQLSQLALDLGQNVKLAGISASDAGRAMAALASGGVSTEDILKGAAEGALLLASSAGIDVAQAAEIAAAALANFGLAGSQAGHIADIFSAASNSSAVTVGDLGESMKYIGPIANAMGLSIEEVTAALAELGDQGIKGSQAGTSLRSILSSLAKPSKQASALIKELGLEFFDAGGKMKSIAGISEQLKTHLSGLTDQQRANALVTLFGNEALSAATVLYGEGAAGIEKYLGQVNVAGSAAANGAKRNDNLKGSIEQLKSSWETASIVLGTAFIPLVRQMVDLLAGAVNAVIPLIKVFGPQFVAALQAGIGQGVAVVQSFAAAVIATVNSIRTGDFSNLFGPLIVAISTAFGSETAGKVTLFVSDLVTNLKLARDAVLTARQAFSGDWVSSDTIATPVRIVGEVFLALGNAVRTAKGWIDQLPTPVLAAAAAFLALGPAIKIAALVLPALIGAFSAFGPLVSILSAVLPVLGTVIAALGLPITALIVAVGLLAAAWLTNFMGIQTTTMPIITAIGALITGTLLPALAQLPAFVTGTLVPQLQAGLAFILPLFVQVGDAIRTAFTTVLPALQSFGSALMGLFTAVAPVVQQIGGLILSSLGPAITAIAGWASTVIPQFAAAWANVLSIVSPILSALAAFITENMGTIQTVVGAVWGIITGIIQAAFTVITTIISAGLQIISGDWSGAWATIQAGAASVWESIKQIVSSAWSGISALLTAGLTGLQNLWGTVWPALQTIAQNAWEGMKTAATAAWDAIKTLVSNAIDALKTKISDGLNSAKDTAKTALDAIATAATTAMDNLKTAIANGMQAAKDRIVTAVGEFAQIVLNVGGALYAAGASIIGQLTAGIASAIGAAVQKVRDGLQEIANLLPHSEPKDPSSPLRGLADAGKALFGTFADGIGRGAPQAIRATQEAAGAIAHSLADTLGRLGTLTDTPSDKSAAGIMRLFAANFEVALETMRATASAAGDFLDQARDYKSMILLAVTAIKEAQAALNTVNFGGGGLPGPQAAGQGLGDGITKGIKKSLDIHSPSQVMVAIGRDVVAGLVEGMDDKAQDAAKKAADIASAVAKAITDTLGAAAALGKLDLTTLPTGGQITGILAFTRALVAEMAASSTILNEDGIKQTSLFSEAASKVASAVSAGITALTALVSFVAPATSAIFAFGKSLRSAVNDLVVLAEQIPLELATAAAAFSEQATKAIGIFGAAVGGFTSLIGFVPPTDRAIYLFDQSVRAAINDLAYLAEQVTLETSDLASKFADGVTKALGVFGVGIDAFSKLHDYEGVTDRAIFDFNKSIKAFIEDFAIVAEKVTLETATLAGKFADGAGKAIAVVGTALSSFSGLAAFVTPGKTAVDGLLATVRYIIARFGEMAQTMSTEGTKQLGDFGAATNAVLGGVKSAIDTFLALDKATVPQTGDLSDLVVAVQGVTTNMAAAAKLLGDDAIKDATAFGSAANGIFTALKSGLDLFAMIDKPGGWPTTDWLQPLIELMGGMLSRGGALLSQAQQLKAVADQFNMTMAGAYAGFATGLGGGGLTLTGNLGGGLAGGGGGAPTTINNYTVTGNTLLSKDTATQQMVSGIVTTQQSRTIGYSTSG